MLYTFHIFRFEFDPDKSMANMQKHGIDFREARELWLDPDRVELPARTEDEPRFLVVGKIGGAYWSSVIAYRGDRIRIISVRRSRTKEIESYES